VSRQILRLEGERFTSSYELAREALALMQATDYVIHIIPKDRKQSDYVIAELEHKTTLGRIKVATR
jgi:hypothetical protein